MMPEQYKSCMQQTGQTLFKTGNPSEKLIVDIYVTRIDIPKNKIAIKNNYTCKCRWIL